jgi:hypothetical protein
MTQKHQRNRDDLTGSLPDPFAPEEDWLRDIQIDDNEGLQESTSECSNATTRFRQWTVPVSLCLMLLLGAIAYSSWPLLFSAFSGKLNAFSPFTSGVGPTTLPLICEGMSMDSVPKELAVKTTDDGRYVGVVYSTWNL